MTIANATATDADISDADLLRRYVARNDTAALETLFVRHADMAYRAALRVTRHAADAQDAVQTAFVKIMRDASKCPADGSVKAWLARVVINAAKDMIKRSVRRRNREETVAAELDSFAKDTALEQDADHADMLPKMLERLPERYRMPVWLHHGEGLSFTEVSHALAIPTDTVRKQASRGVAMLKAVLARAGVPASAASLGALFAVPAAEAAPPALLDSLGPIMESGGTAGLSPVSARLAGRSLSASASWLKSAVAAALVAGAVGSGGILHLRFRSRQQAESPPAPSVAENQRAGLPWRWDFETPNVPELLRPALGSWRHLPNGGPYGSGCMETVGDQFQLILDFPVQDFPVRISCRVDSIWPYPAGGQMIAVGWADYDRVLEFKGVADYEPGQVHPDIRGGQNIGWWAQMESYVMSDRIVTTTDGRLAIAMAYEPRSADTRLALFGRGAFRIDYLEISSVSPEDVPDISHLLEAAHAVPPELRDGRPVPLPGLKPGRLHRQVEAVFHNYR